MKTFRQLVDTMNTTAVVYQLAHADHQREGTGSTYRALEVARVNRRAAAGAVDAAIVADLATTHGATVYVLAA